MRYDPNLVPMESDFDNGDEEKDVMYLFRNMQYGLFRRTATIVKKHQYVHGVRSDT